MATKAPASGHVETNTELAVGQRAPGAVPAAATSVAHKSKFGNDAIAEKGADKPGMPAGYKPDTSVTFKAGKEGEPDMLVNADGTKEAVSQANKAQSNAMENLPKDHTYRDRVEAQARSLGVPVIEGETLEYLMWKIRMMASS